MAHVKQLDRLVRRFVPSTAVLSHRLPFRMAAYIVDAFTRPFWRLYTRRPIPPLRYMVRTGVGNRILFPHFLYLTVGANQWLYFLARGWVRPDSVIVDIGSGSGKSAVTWRDFRYGGQGFTGQYTGFDVDAAMVEWCRRHFPAEHFRFVHVDMRSSVYNMAGSVPTPPLDCADDSVDFVFSQSLFSHLLEDQVLHYLQEGRRILRPGGHMAMTFFCLDDLAAQNRLGGRWRFDHRIGRAWIEDPRYPEAAVGYRRSTILEMCEEAGFAQAEVILPHFQSTLWCRK